MFHDHLFEDSKVIFKNVLYLLKYLLYLLKYQYVTAWIGFKL